jgi:hypothetical protein
MLIDRDVYKEADEVGNAVVVAGLKVGNVGCEVRIDVVGVKDVELMAVDDVDPEVVVAVVVDLGVVVVDLAVDVVVFAVVVVDLAVDVGVVAVDVVLLVEVVAELVVLDVVEMVVFEVVVDVVDEDVVE